MSRYKSEYQRSEKNGTKSARELAPRLKQGQQQENSEYEQGYNAGEIDLY